MAKRRNARHTENLADQLVNLIECHCAATIRCDICRCRETLEADTHKAARQQLLELVIEKGWRIIDNEVVCRPCGDIVRSADSD